MVAWQRALARPQQQRVGAELVLFPVSRLPQGLQSLRV